MTRLTDPSQVPRPSGLPPRTRTPTSPTSRSPSRSLSKLPAPPPPTRTDTTRLVSISHDLSRTHCTSLTPSRHMHAHNRIPHRISHCTSALGSQFPLPLFSFLPSFPLLDARSCFKVTLTCYRARARRTHPRPRLPINTSAAMGRGHRRARLASTGRIGTGRCISHMYLIGR